MQINVSAYANLLSCSEENKLTYDGPSRKARIEFNVRRLTKCADNHIIFSIIASILSR